MNNAETLTQKWLRQNIQSYARGDRVYADVNAVLSRFPTIRPKTDVYTFDDGRTQLLLCVHGLLPITFRQASYHIPIAIWVAHDYPRQPPLVYVVPTSDMLVKAGKYMDVSGRCNIPYVQNWERKSEACNLLSLMEDMQEQFSREPPVYAKSRHTEARTASRPSTPVQGEFPRITNRPTAQTLNNDQPPPIPPKPGAPVPSGIQSYPESVSWLRQQEPVGRIMSPAVPPRPTPHHGMYVASPQHQRSVSMHGSSPPTSPSPRPLHHSSVPMSPSNQRWSMPPPQIALHPHRTGQVFQSTPDSPMGNTHMAPPSQSFVSSNAVTPRYAPPPLSESVPRPPPPNFLEELSNESREQIVPSHGSVHAPPRPLNPELVRLHADVHAKFSSEFASLSQAMELDADRLRAHQRDLLIGEPAIRDEMARLEAVKDVCSGVARRLRGVVRDLEKNVSELKKKGDPEVDELVCSTTIVHNQLINLVAEENAIEDTIYHLHRALNTGRIDLDRFLRTTRVLAEEQFMKKALVEKIQTGLPMSQWT
ncbi:UEV-domain-containing protein [Neolentinus lepideus HHB14362 ss-1]|uniref:UEV-domain-containing protein n=1 Tax=Neolentinus lepideus HHB14362 ss-1 TaxID=1314782 RepID=A0A165T739_9AGAM|nr:UEV-domain-containing protein [Neolentinus lepideus HHB14362 ss-1]